MSVSPSRRRLLQVAAASPAIAACTTRQPRPARIDPDDILRNSAVARELTLLDRYDAAIAAATPAVAATLSSVRAEHVVHLGALRRPLTTTGPTPSRPTAPPPAPTTAQLAAAERSAAAAHAADALRASGPLASVLASLAASEASHPVALS